MSILELAKRVRPGQPPIFKSPIELWEKALEYFEWEDGQELNEVKGVGFQGDYSLQDIPHKPPYTIQGLCIYCNLSSSSLFDYSKRPEYSEVIGLVKEIIFKQKFNGAVVGLYNANIIARDLGLKDKVDVTTNDESINTNVDEDLELARKIAFALRSVKERAGETTDE